MVRLCSASARVMPWLTVHHIKAAPRSAWPTTTAAQAMLPAAQMQSTSPDADLWAALVQMDQDGVNQLPVLSNQHMLGMLSRDSLISFLRTARELGV